MPCVSVPPLAPAAPRTGERFLVQHDNRLMRIVRCELFRNLPMNFPHNRWLSLFNCPYLTGSLTMLYPNSSVSP